MKKYQCIRKCYAYGKKWKLGDVFDTTVEPNHHFTLIEGDAVTPKENLVPADLKKPVRDPMKPKTSTSEARSFSQMQGSDSPIKNGMAAGMGELDAINSPREMVTR